MYSRLRGAKSLGLVALVALAGLELAATWLTATRAPRFADYAALAAPAGALLEAGDVLVVSPRWAEPMVRQALGDERLTLASVAAPSMESARHVVEVSVLGARAAELEGWSEVASASHDRFELRRLENPTFEPALFDAVDGLEPRGSRRGASVTLSGGARCMFDPLSRPVAGDLGGHPTWPRGRFMCPGPAHVTVGVTVIADRDWRPRRCVLAHPPPVGEIALRYRGVRLGSRLVGHGGLYWMTERARAGAPIELRVEVDGTEVGRFIHADGDGWAPFEMELGARSEALHEVTFFVSSPGVRARDFCFEVRSL